MLSTLLLALMCGWPVDEVDENLIETLKDAQATHREAWSRGRAHVRLKISTPEKMNPAVIEGEIAWRDTSFILKLQASDPDEAYFKQNSNNYVQEGNFIARGSDFEILYIARSNRLVDKKPNSRYILSILELSPLVEFAFCCPPTASEGRPWKDAVGPSPNLPEPLRTSRFSYRRLPNGDVEQTRQDEDGHKVVIIFSAQYDMAVASSRWYDPQGKNLDHIEYTYTRKGDGRILPATCLAEVPAPRGMKVYRYEYEYRDVVIPDSTPASAFTREAVLARVRRETPYGRRRTAPKAPVVDDAKLESLSRELKENGTAKP